MNSQYFSNSDADDADLELDHRRAEAIARIANFTQKMYELDRLRLYVAGYQRPKNWRAGAITNFIRPKYNTYA